MKLTIEVDVSDRRLHDIFVAAMKGGVQAWAVVDNYSWSKGGDGKTPDLQGFGATLTPCLEDVEDVVEFPVTRETIINGLHALARAGHITTVVRIATGEYDSDDADLLVQFALFGEEVYP